eukprot:CAMPEP_0170521076 /NCGR_PEP_ID=MMETSP0209-20121228/6386_1 /TAXON_ID=665100 ORGANISM="Litonotus pictus, Strain P1" /NCGR_SAMPLE_ID=MMETSP0209 /ASSEMBLY_ACC=CAM_ASM_000301 /LENGTH=480 /DNA_ID=CAMNT_0010807721 /DNA_START=422 /DNA_END=1861 /DNA_ORIENTATION=-
MCGFNISYGEGSNYSGLIVEDYLLLGDDYHQGDQKLFPFGCVSNETKLFYTQPANGILGLAPSGNKKAAFITLAKQKGLIQKQIFSICYSTTGGFITFGDLTNKYSLAKSNDLNDIKYINYNSGNMYKIMFKSYSFHKDSKKEVSSRYYTVIDSGTTLTYLPTDLYKEFNKNLENYCLKNDCKSKFKGGCFEPKAGVSKEEITKLLPNFYFYLGDSGEMEMVWEAKNYVTIDENDRKKFCIGTYSWRSSEIILGGTWMHNQNIIFDIDNSKIGIVPSNCGGFSSERSEIKSDSEGEGSDSGEDSDSHTTGTTVESEKDSSLEEEVITHEEVQSVIYEENGYSFDKLKVTHIDWIRHERKSNQPANSDSSAQGIDTNASPVSSLSSESDYDSNTSTEDSTTNAVDNIDYYQAISCFLHKSKNSDLFIYIVLDVLLIFLTGLFTIGCFYFIKGRNFLCFSFNSTFSMEEHNTVNVNDVSMSS